MRLTLSCALLVLVVTVACDRSPRAEPPQVAEARTNAARDACATAELSTRAQHNLETLSDLAAAGSVGPATAAVGFSRAYANHAELRHAAVARLDSAVNHARGTADSLRLVQAAGSFRPGRPEAGTVEANVAAAYNRDFSEILGDEDHRCNWSI